MSDSPLLRAVDSSQNNFYNINIGNCCKNPRSKYLSSDSEKWLFRVILAVGLTLLVAGSVTLAGNFLKNRVSLPLLCVGGIFIIVTVCKNMFFHNKPISTQNPITTTTIESDQKIKSNTVLDDEEEAQKGSHTPSDNSDNEESVQIRASSSDSEDSQSGKPYERSAQIHPRVPKKDGTSFVDDDQQEVFFEKDIENEACRNLVLSSSDSESEGEDSIQKQAISRPKNPPVESADGTVIVEDGSDEENNVLDNRVYGGTPFGILDR